MDESDKDTLAEDLLHRLRASFTALNNEEHLVNKLQGLVRDISWSPKEATDLFDALLKRFESTTKDRSHLLSWMLELLHCIQINLITPSWRSPTEKTLTESVRDTAVSDEELQRWLADEREKQLDEIIEEIRQQKSNQIDETLLNDVRDIVSSFDKDIALPDDGSQSSSLKKVLFKLCQAAEITHFRPRLTQMVSWCIMALSKTGQLIQVGTGEGKSCIVAMFAAFRALRGERVDIMSSSSVLAERDLEEWKDFFKCLNISVKCNTNKQVKQLKECYTCQVVYGTVEQFAGDWLRHHFHRMDIFGTRTFQCAIVDEVDSLMLDKGHHTVYLSSDMPALQNLNPLLAFIWAAVNQYSKIGTEITVGQKYPFHQVVLENIKKCKDVQMLSVEFTILQIAEDTGILPKGSVKDIRQNMSPLTDKTATVTVNQLAKFFMTVERKYPCCQFALHCMNNNGAIEELKTRAQQEAEVQRVPLLLMNGGFCQYMYSSDESVQRAVEEEIQSALHFTPCELGQDKMHCYVPGFLSNLVKFKLKVWIENAFYAKTMTEDHQYIIEKHGVVPVDYSCTGVVENNMKWTDGLQQFVEMKHESKLSDMTAITNYMSYVGLLQKYGDQIFGISGTLGQEAETETLQKIYEGIKTCQIPSFKRRKLFEVEGVIVENEKEWIEKICNVVFDQTNPTSYRDQRAVLVICETINQAKVLHHALGDKVLSKKLYISNNMDNSAVLKNRLETGEVIIATNLAGRGTDLHVSESVKGAGGLFVVQTFLPNNARVEAQAFGRTARQGSPGSAQLIVCFSHLSHSLQLLVLTNKLERLVRQLRSYQEGHGEEISKDMPSTLSHITNEIANSEIKTVKKVRDDLVSKGLASYLESDVPKIKKKEELFSEYLTIQEVYKSSNNKPEDSYLSALNEFWGMWLLTDFNENYSIEDLKTKLTNDLKKAMTKLGKRESPASNLHHYTAFGNELRKKESLQKVSICTQRPYKRTIAGQRLHITTVLCISNPKNSHQDPNCISQALVDLQNALKSVELCCDQTQVTHGYSKQVKGFCSDSDTRFDNQMIARYKVLLYFKVNISEAIKKLDRARDLGGNVKVEESLTYFLVPLMHFLPLAVISTGPLTAIRRDPLVMLQLITHPSFDIIHELMSLESLGLTHVYTLDTLFSLGGFFSKIQRTINRVFD